MHDFKNANKMENTNNHQPRAHFNIFNNSSLVFTL